MPGKALTTLFVLLDLGLAYLCAPYLEQVWVHPLEHSEQKQVSSALDPTPVAAVCVSGASETYQVPSNVLAGIRSVEGGHIGQAARNANGTYDLGPMQVNSLWVPRLAKLWNVDYQTAYVALRDNGCENVYSAAWILKQNIVKTGGLHNGIASYHSATRRYGRPYARKVEEKMARQGYSQP